MSFSESQHEKSFNNLFVYLHNLRRTNTHTYTHIKTDLMDRFEACFVVIGWVINSFLFPQIIKIHAFVGCFLPVIFTGSVPLRGDYPKTMFVVVAIDGNNHTLSIACGLAVENNLYYCT
uniref:Uncharacterized protein n=1 Tax=Lactuca sativa TaxID=4236 RepID=A0A9R1WP49_LACSA|nr:hypothetical protein LSAT_V11C100030650 [Lactuca sativa]